MQNSLYQKESQVSYDFVNITINIDEKLLININKAPSQKWTVFEIKFGT